MNAITSLTICEKKLNIYKLIHKYARSELSRVVELAGCTDFTDNEEKDLFIAQFLESVQFLEDHAEREHRHIHPLLSQLQTMLFDTVEAEHADLECILSKLKNTVNDINTNQAGYAFYLEFANFQARYLLHLNYEETQLLPYLHQQYSNDDLSAVSKRLIDGMSQQQVNAISKVMFMKINHDELVQMFQSMQESMPEPVFQLMCKLAASVISEKKYQKLINTLSAVKV